MTPAPLSNIVPFHFLQGKHRLVIHDNTYHLHLQENTLLLAAFTFLSVQLKMKRRKGENKLQRTEFDLKSSEYERKNELSERLNN